MLLSVVLYLIGTLICLGIASELLARGTENLEDSLGQGIAGGLILGLLTALPETIITVLALIEGKYDIALGSAIGGNVILFTFGIGLIGIVYFITWKKDATITSEYKVENNFLIANSIIMVIILIYGKIDLFSGLILIFLYIYYVYYRIKNREDSNKKEGRKEEKAPNYKLSVIELTLGCAIILGFSGYFIDYINIIAKSLNIPEVWLSLILTPIAAELEEKISGIRLAMRREDGASLALISFVGSKIENGTLLLGIIGLFTSFNLYSTLPEYLAAIVANLLGIISLYNRKISKYESMSLILVYFIIVFSSYIF
ncbi:sodium:calcium antiporter [Acidianus sulfidivorans JP7]|uniref:Na(+)/Ca(2+) exchanging n=1 Tax=Acidianus sulfidivorans JP7 TaxID=619593 RepID=A0A2U9IPG9_9CREN|nr:sodium:calcium antiporter [Acidianus sulfidivorans]AWR97877.1 sodium:calcium antiporter [Acidianus sulfidivorans JP7]